MLIAKFNALQDGLKLVKLRGESMQAAADAQKSSMASVIGLDAAAVLPCCAAAVARPARCGVRPGELKQQC